MAAHLISAHAENRPIRQVTLWNRTPERAQKLARSLRDQPFKVSVTGDLESAVRRADIVSVATLSERALIRGSWLAPGCHVDLVGAFRPDMRESDDETMRRSLIYVDTIDGALAEAGDLIQALKAGAIAASDIAGDLRDLVALGPPDAPDRIVADDYSRPTLFKSVGHGIEDLATAALVYEGL